MAPRRLQPTKPPILRERERHAHSRKPRTLIDVLASARQTQEKKPGAWKKFTDSTFGTLLLIFGAAAALLTILFLGVIALGNNAEVSSTTPVPPTAYRISGMEFAISYWERAEDSQTITRDNNCEWYEGDPIEKIAKFGAVDVVYCREHVLKLVETNDFNEAEFYLDTLGKVEGLVATMEYYALDGSEPIVAETHVSGNRNELMGFRAEMNERLKLDNCIYKNFLGGIKAGDCPEQ
ncbi:hypothetical protein A2976_03670 [candidate division WWE3 bacterium RIFCSPLOWO2_01_FULL_41_9]|uniref:Uncharacterized protein n=2 Tax=Katanobacteria TaxID=422282 RepID=A0A1F4VIF9_UNCKA|nr:MAG: hypothetical protein A2976_03670 [candidate division WWE3 bacterium RIFCSPLOWO2_01_FULL_41_9]